MTAGREFARRAAAPDERAGEPAGSSGAARLVVGGAVDWSELLRLRAPAALFEAWGRLAGLPLILVDRGGREVARFGGHAPGGCCAGCAGRTARAAAAPCRHDPALRHLVAPVVLGDAVAGWLVTAAYAERGRSGADRAPFALDPAGVAVLAGVLDVAAQEMALHWRTVRGSVGRGGPRTLIGDSPPMRDALLAVRRFARTERTVLVTGETGTGKELVAHAIHAQSRRAAAPLLVVHCGAIAEGLIESELFGHRRGAFTDAFADRRGVFELADRGTLLLDEVPSMSPALQAKLLRVLEQGTFVPVGGCDAIRADVRVLAATNRDLAALVREGSFREDLYHRLDVLRIRVAPLRERTGDIPLLAEHFAARVCAEEGYARKALAPEALGALERYPWPGNVRELAHAIERAVIGSPPGLVRLEDLPCEVREAAPAPAPGGGPALARGSLRELKRREIERWERRFLGEALERCGGNQSRLARELRVNRTKLGEKLRRYGLTGDEAGG